MDQKRADKRTIPELFQHFWSQALVAVTGAEEDAVKLLGKVQEAAGWSQEEIRRQAREFSERLTGQRKELEARVEATVQASLGRLHVPRREEIEQLSARVESLAKRLETLEK
jgi:poly(hydroxyalkanoate) granule-associated protein